MKNLYLFLAAILGVQVSVAQNIPNGSTVASLPQTNTLIAQWPFSFTTPLTYTRTLVPQVAAYTDVSTLTDLTNPMYVQMATVYKDGFNRPMQAVLRHAVPFYDNVQMFDNRPNTNKQSYLPYPWHVAGSGFHMNANTEQHDYYTATFPDEGDNTAGSELLYQSDASARNLYSFAPGKTAVGEGHGSKTTTGSNADNEVIIWGIDASTGWPSKVGYYAAGQLTKKVVTTDDGANVTEYYDNEGKLISRRILTEINDCYIFGGGGTTSTSTGGVVWKSTASGSTLSPDDLMLVSLDPNQSNTAYQYQYAQDFGANTYKSLVYQSLDGDIGKIIDQIVHLTDPTVYTGSVAAAGGTRAYNPTCPVYVMTYYVYDFYGRLTHVLHPKAVQYLSTNSWVMTSTILNNLCDYVIYDGLGRTVETHKAGEIGNSQVVYDNHDRAVLSNTPNDNGGASIRWDWSHYDKFSRVIQSGDINTTYNRATIQGWFDANTLPGTLNTTSSIFYYLFLDNQQGNYISVPLSTGITASNINAVNYYDTYSYPSFFNGTSMTGFGFAYNPGAFTGRIVYPSTAVAPPAAASAKIKGKLTYRAVRVVKPYAIPALKDFTVSANYYDDYGRLVQIFNNNAHNGYDEYCTQYDFKGRPLSQIHLYDNPLCAKRYTNVITHYYYNQYNQSLTSIGESIDGAPERPISAFSYNSLNQNTLKVIGGIEQQKYTYNIRGSLTGINPDYAETGSTGGANITFGESIKYDAGFTNHLFCGGISGIIWKSAGNPSQAYGYRYDLSGKLIQSDFREYSGSPEAWNNTNNDFTEGGIKYDANGNILNMVRYGALGSSSSPGMIDNLTYVYANSYVSNKIANITDAIPSATTTSTDYDFKDGPATGVDYEYDNNGSVTRDHNNKNISTTYTPLNKPSQRSFLSTSGDHTDFVYDAQGNKLEEITTLAGVSKTTDYQGKMVFEDNAISKIFNQDGYCTYNTSSTPTFDYYFFVRDHLGNVRNVLYSRPDVSSGSGLAYYRATHEDGNAQTEEQIFDNIPFVRSDKPGATTLDDMKTATLDANNPNRIVGTTLLLKVNYGDQFDITAQSYYPDSVESEGEIAGEDLLGAFMESLVGQNGGKSGPDGNANTYSKMFSAENVNLYSAAIDPNDINPDVPQAFLNYMAFDEKFQLIPEASGRVQIGAAAGTWNTIGTMGAIGVLYNGYLVVSISTSTKGIPVSIDDVSVTHYVGELRDINHYYPYGLAVDITSHIPSVSDPVNLYLYQTMKQDKTHQLYIDDFGARQYDPQIGRFLGIDAANQFPSGYTGMGNNPVSTIDPTGNEDDPFEGDGGGDGGGTGLSGSGGGQSAENMTMSTMPPANGGEIKGITVTATRIAPFHAPIVGATTMVTGDGWRSAPQPVPVPDLPKFSGYVLGGAGDENLVKAAENGRGRNDETRRQADLADQAVMLWSGTAVTGPAIGFGAIVAAETAPVWAPIAGRSALNALRPGPGIAFGSGFADLLTQVTTKDIDDYNPAATFFNTFFFHPFTASLGGSVIDLSRNARAGVGNRHILNFNFNAAQIKSISAGTVGNMMGGYLGGSFMQNSIFPGMSSWGSGAGNYVGNLFGSGIENASKNK